MKTIHLALAAALALTAAACERPSGLLLPGHEAAAVTPPHERNVVLPRLASACTPGGLGSYGGRIWIYNHAANGEFSENACWNPVRVTHTTSSTCGFGDSGYQFGSSASISQNIVVPASFHATNWDFEYRMDFIDPNNDGYRNTLRVRVTDLTTGQTLATIRHRGSDPDVSCGGRLLTFDGDLAGHTLSVSFTGSAAYSNTTIRVLGAALWQY